MLHCALPNSTLIYDVVHHVSPFSISAGGENVLHNQFIFGNNRRQSYRPYLMRVVLKWQGFLCLFWIWHFTQIFYGQHFDFSVLGLEDSIERVNAQQRACELAVVAQDHLGLSDNATVSNITLNRVVNITLNRIVNSTNYLFNSTNHIFNSTKIKHQQTTFTDRIHYIGVTLSKFCIYGKQQAQ